MRTPAPSLAARATILAAASALCFGGASLAAGAQTTAQHSQTAAPNPAAHPPPRQAVPDDPAKIAAAREFIEVYRPLEDPKNISRNLDTILVHQAETAKAHYPNLDTKKFIEIRKSMILENARRRLEFESRIVSHYFTLDEFRQLMAFYTGPIGQKLVSEIGPIGVEMDQERRAGQLKLIPPQEIMQAGIPEAPANAAKPGETPAKSGVGSKPATPGGR